MEIDHAIDAFLAHLRDHRRASPHTLRAYGQDLSHWAGELSVKGISSVAALSEKLSAAHLRAYIAS